MAQRQRAGLITPRSLDRNELPVWLQFSCFTEAAPVHTWTLSSLVAQWKRAVKHRQLPPRCENIRKTDGYRLMSRRSHDRNVSGEYHHTSHRCIKALEQPTQAPVAQRKSTTPFVFKHDLTSPTCEWLSPHTWKVVGSKPTRCIYTLVALQKQLIIVTCIPPLAHRQQRRAHNYEVTVSTLVGGIHFYRLQYF